jgi:signal transduction histidine kinase
LAWRSTSVPEDGLVFATARDVTEHKRLQELARRQAEDLVRSNADLEQFAAIASHDLQAPLRGVHTLADWIEQDLPQDAPATVHEHLRTLRRRVDLMARLVADLLAYARAGREEEAVQVTDTGALVADIVEMIAPPAGLKIVVNDDLPELETASSALEQVLRNLIVNAIEHHDRDAGTVRIAARRRGEQWELSVADDGPGIPREARDKVFEMLWSSSSGERRGTGMGLALVRRLVERVGGRVWIDPHEGRGTTIRFTWPNKLMG